MARARSSSCRLIYCNLSFYLNKPKQLALLFIAFSLCLRCRLGTSDSGQRTRGDKVDIADRLLPTWDTPFGIPHNIIILAYGGPQILDGLGYILCSSHHWCQATALLVRGTSHSFFVFGFNFLALVPVVFLFLCRCFGS